MIAEGALEKPRPSAIFALHVAPIEVGTIGTTPGTGLPGFEILEVQMTGGPDLPAAAKELASFLQSATTVKQSDSQRIIGAIIFGLGNRPPQNGNGGQPPRGRDGRK